MNEQPDPFERRLRDHLRSVDGASLPGVTEVNRAVDRVVRGRQVRARVLAGAVSVLAVVAAGAALANRSPDAGIASVPSVVTLPVVTLPVVTLPAVTPPPVVSTATASPWISLPTDPRGVRHSAAVVWTGTEAIAFGGRDESGTAHDDAAAYNPASGTWRIVSGQAVGPSSPVNVLAVWAGDRALLIGGEQPTGGQLKSGATAYVPATDSWSVVASPPLSFVTDRSPAAWTGAELLVWPGDVGTDVAPEAYDPATDEWRVLPVPPVQSRQQAASVWTGSEWIVWGGTGANGELADGAAYNPATNSWRELSGSPLGARRVRAVWTGTEMLLAAGSSGGSPVSGDGEMALSDGAAYDPSTDTWRSLTPGFAHPGFLPVWTGDFMVMFAKGGAVVYDPAEDAWIDVCCNGTVVSNSLPLFTGTQILVLGSYDGRTGGGGIDVAVLTETSPAP